MDYNTFRKIRLEFLELNKEFGYVEQSEYLYKKFKESNFDLDAFTTPGSDLWDFSDFGIYILSSNSLLFTYTSVP